MHLTYPNSDTHTGTASTAKAKAKDAGAPEVEVTEAMILAGEDVLLSRLGGAVSTVFWFPRDLAVEVFSAMRSAGCKGSKAQDGQRNP